MNFTDDIAPLITLVIRHGGTFLAGYLATKGVISGDEKQIVVSGLVALAALGWSVWQKRQQKAAVATAAITGNTPAQQRAAQ